MGWKGVEWLRAKGFRIEAAPLKGYRLRGVPDRVSAAEIAPLLETRQFGREIVHYERIGSTNAEAFHRAQGGAAHGTLVIAEFQEAGRGRRGRNWVSPFGCDFLGSLVLRPSVPPSRAPEITLLAAVALAKAIESAGVSQPKIKWPNDIQRDGLKVAGVLTELAADQDRIHFAVLGIGVNINSNPGEMAKELAQRATSLRAIVGARIDRAGWIARFLGHLEETYTLWETDGFRPIREEWRKRTSTIGSRVRISIDAKMLEGRAIDIDDTGALLVEAGSTLHRIVAGDVEELRTTQD